MESRVIGTKTRLVKAPPRRGLDLAVFSLVAVPRALVWLLRVPDLRLLCVAPALLTLVLGAALLVLSVWVANPLADLLVQHGSGALAEITFVALMVVIHGVLGLWAVLTAYSLQGALAAAVHERMADIVVARLQHAPPPAPISLRRFVTTTTRALLPGLAGLLVQGFCVLASLAFVLVPGVGPGLALLGSLLITSMALARGALVSCRGPLRIPTPVLLRAGPARWGLALGLLVVSLVPLLGLLAGPVATVAGTFVAHAVHEAALQSTGNSGSLRR